MLNFIIKKHNLFIISHYKNYIKSSKYKTNVKNKKIKKSKLMFLRAPKHFKVGKQFLVNQQRIQIKKFNIKNIDYRLIILLKSFNLHNFYINFDKEIIPEAIITKITYKFKIIFKLNGWCFIF